MNDGFVTLEPGLLSTIDAAAFDAAGSRLALGGWGHGRVIDVATESTLWEGELLGAGLDPEDHGVMRVVAISPSGRYAFFGADGHTGGSGSYGFFLVDLATNTWRELFENPPNACTFAIFSRDETTLYALTHAGLLVFDLAGGGRRSIELPTEDVAGIDRVALIPMSDAELLVAAGTSLFEVSLVAGRATSVGASGTHFASHGSGLPGGAALLTAQAGGRPNRALRYREGGLEELFATKHTIVWVSPSGEELFLVAEDEEGTPRLLRRRLDAGKTTRIALPEALMEELSGSPWVFAVSPDGRHALLAPERYQTDEVFLVRLPAGRPR